MHRVTFSACKYLDEIDGELLRNKLCRERAVACPEVFEALPVLVGRGSVAVSLPLGTLVHDFRAIASDPAMERQELEAMIASVKRATGRRRFRRRDVVFHCDGEVYLRRPALEALALLRDARAPMLRAALGLLAALEAAPPWRHHARRRERRPIAERELADGRRARGPGWTKEEDAELRRTFGVGLDGERLPRLAASQWSLLLVVKLAGLRTKGSVLARLVRLRRGCP